MAVIKNLEDLQVWVRAKALAVCIYKITGNEHFKKDLSLTDQLRRGVISVSSNIAEGFERNGNKEFIQFLSYAKGSCGEIRSQLEIAADLEYLTKTEKEEVVDEISEISRMIGGLIEYLKSSDRKGSKFENQN